ncbi:NADPH:quinone oxidoreductase family protein [bacterium]|nr:NADPH:quinone oxidoreductase family protein [bacterium]
MKAIRFDELGNENILRVVDIPKPEPADGEVLVRVKAAGLNPVDVLITAGYYFRKPPLPYQPGFEGAGVIDVVGSSITDYKPGDRVTFRQGSVGFGRVQGSFAEFVTCYPDDLHKTPDQFSDEDAGGFWLAGLTAWGGLIHLLDVKPGETVVITAASGGVGHIAVQLAKSFGATVIATTRSDEKIERLKLLGADHVINSEKSDLVDTIRQLGGADHAFDAVGGDTTMSLMKALKPLGRVVVYGAVSRKPPVVDFASLIANATGILGFTMMTLRESPALLKRAEDDLLVHITKGSLKPIIGSRFSLDEAPAAWRAIKDGIGFGKILLKP